MRERQIDQPAAIGAPGGQGLGRMLSPRRGVVEHGGDTIGVAAMLRMVPESGVAVAVLTNGGTAGPLIDELIDPLPESWPRSQGEQPGSTPAPTGRRRYLRPH